MPGDPRSIVTPDAFSVTPELLGTPLATPRRRFAALAVDLVLIGFLQLLGWRVLGGLVGLMLFRLATRRADGAPSTRARKLGLGCAGATVLVVAVGATFIPALLRMASPGSESPIQLQLGDDTVSIGAPADPGVVDLASAVAEREERIRELEEQLQEVDSRSTLFTWIRDAADEAGLVFGWGTVYLTLFLALWGGRTPGKKLFGLRVVRLNGQPLGLLMSLERAGGYAAGFATGLLGFARVWWDPNRQGIHDKIAETVVIREGLPNLLYRQGAVAAPGPQDDREPKGDQGSRDNQPPKDNREPKNNQERVG